MILLIGKVISCADVVKHKFMECKVCRVYLQTVFYCHSQLEVDLSVDFPAGLHYNIEYERYGLLEK